jgi:hypothetical protein
MVVANNNIDKTNITSQTLVISMTMWMRRYDA